MDYVYHNGELGYWENYCLCECKGCPDEFVPVVSGPITEGQFNNRSLVHSIWEPMIKEALERHLDLHYKLGEWKE